MGNAKGAYPPREDRTVVEGAEIAPAIALRRTDAHADPKVLPEVLEVFYVRSLTPKVPTRAVRAGRRSDWRCGASLRRQGRKSGRKSGNVVPKAARGHHRHPEAAAKARCRRLGRHRRLG